VKVPGTIFVGITFDFFTGIVVVVVEIGSVVDVVDVEDVGNVVVVVDEGMVVVDVVVGGGVELLARNEIGR
jgi:hypothetical protein